MNFRKHFLTLLYGLSMATNCICIIVWYDIQHSMNNVAGNSTSPISKHKRKILFLSLMFFAMELFAPIIIQLPGSVYFFCTALYAISQLLTAIFYMISGYGLYTTIKHNLSMSGIQNKEQLESLKNLGRQLLYFGGFIMLSFLTMVSSLWDSFLFSPTGWTLLWFLAIFARFAQSYWSIVLSRIPKRIRRRTNIAKKTSSKVSAASINSS